MRPWMIVLSSALGAIVVAAAIAIPEVTNAPRSDITSILVAHSPVLIIAALAVYALSTVLLTTASLVTSELRFRNDLMSTLEVEQPVGRQRGAFSNQFGQLAASLTYRGTTDNGSGFEPRLSGSEARREIARLYYILLARSHFPSALIVLGGTVALGLAQDHGSLPLQPATIPTASAALIMAGLVLLYVLGRIAVDVTAEPLLEAISQLKVTERTEVGLLRRAVELLQLAANIPASDRQLAPRAAELPERLVETVEYGQHLLTDALSRFSENTEALEAAIQACVKPLEAAISAGASQPDRTDDGMVAAAAFSQLHAAVEELTAVLRQLSAVPERATETIVATDVAPPAPRPPTPQLARELRQLLQEIEAAR